MQLQSLIKFVGLWFYRLNYKLLCLHTDPMNTYIIIIHQIAARKKELFSREIK